MGKKKSLLFKPILTDTMALAIDKLTDSELRSLLEKIFKDESAEISGRAEGYYDVLQLFIIQKQRSRDNTTGNLPNRKSKVAENQTYKPTEDTAPQRKNKSLLDGLEIKYQNGYNPDC